MAQEIISRAEAQARGLKRYFTGKSCKHGHVCERKTLDGHCCLCNKERSYSTHQRERHKRNMKVVRDRNPEKYRKIAKRSADKYRDRDLAKNRRYHRNYQIEWVKNNIERKRELARRWTRKNPQAARAIKHRRRANETNAEGFHTADDLKDIMRLQKSRCAHCQRKFGKTLVASLDHIIPLSRGGSNLRKNLQFLCVGCNSSKNNRDAIDFARSAGKLL